MRTLAVLLALSLTGCGWFRDCDVPLLLTVRARPAAKVTVGPSGSHFRTNLGTTPLSRAPGACVGDTVRLERAPPSTKSRCSSASPATSG